VQRFLYGRKATGNKIDFETNSKLIKAIFSVT
jgi:hypothetical protein